MREIIYRRYHRLVEEGQPLPQLIVVDGGKGQLSAAVSSLDELGLRGKIAIVGIAKRLEEIYFQVIRCRFISIRILSRCG